MLGIPQALAGAKKEVGSTRDAPCRYRFSGVEPHSLVGAFACLQPVSGISAPSLASAAFQSELAMTASAAATASGTGGAAEALAGGVSAPAPAEDDCAGGTADAETRAKAGRTKQNGTQRASV